ncbi:MAG: arginyl-tRNA synthetase [Thermomicrobiales bacterium]|nr:arginyl-tRNA synthetase [Thermomicrobiales bacterium]
MSEQPGGPGGDGIVAHEAHEARAAIATALTELGVAPPARGIDLRPVPFAGTWGVASSVCHAIAGDLVLTELETSGALDGLSKKEAKQKASEATRTRAQELAESIVTRVRQSNGFSQVEAANGFVNIYFDANVVASHLIGEVLRLGSEYGKGAPKTERVMVEHSQPNTHKIFHVGHLRNSCLGIAVSNVLAASGYPVMQATYPGDIGMHVIKCLWCYERFHKGEEPTDPLMRGRWLAQVYAESDARLEYRKEVLEFLHLLAREDQVFVAAIDRLLKYLWRKNTHGEDIAYLLGRFTHAQEVKDDLLREEDVIVKFWPILGDQLRDEVVNQKPYVPVEGVPEPTTTPEERLARWQELNQHIDWWLDVPRWREEVKETFQRWERQEPEFVKLWEETREWSLADFRRIFAELGAHFDVWFYESEVEQSGKLIVQELLEKGIAEISDGLPVVKIDVKLGLEKETYRTMPVLRSDGTSLYATKDLSLTKRKFEEYGIDRAVWVVDVRQSLYFQQVFKVLELLGFEQAKKAHHLGYEIVALPEGVISSRKGNVPVYDDIRDLVLARAREIIEEKNPDLEPEAKERVARQVGLGSLKYAMLARDNNKVVIFDLEEALSFDGHAAPYIQYAHARACRILENAGSDGETERRRDGQTGLALDFGELKAEELGLLQQIAVLPEEIQRAAEQYRPLLIANYAFELAKRFNDFYHACPVIQSPEPVRTARLALVDATRTALANSLALLGIEAPGEM